MSKSVVKAVTRLPQFAPGEWHDIPQAAALLKVSERRMRRWVYNGSIGSKVLPGGRGRRISGAHLNAWVNADDAA